MSSRKKEICILAAILIVVVALAAGLPFYLSGETSTGGENPEPEPTDAVTCESEEISYPFITAQYGEVSHKMSIKMVFMSGTLNSLGLYYDVDYVDSESAQAAYNTINADFNTVLSRAGLTNGRDLNVRYYKNTNDAGFSLYINRDNTIDNALLQFVMLSGIDDMPVKKSDFINRYEVQGFSCSQTIK